MRRNHQIGPGLVAALIVFMITGYTGIQGNKNTGIQTGRSATIVDLPVRQKILMELGQIIPPDIPLRLSVETVEENWGCEYMMELPGTCIMRV